MIYVTGYSSVLQSKRHKDSFVLSAEKVAWTRATGVIDNHVPLSKTTSGSIKTATYDGVSLTRRQHFGYHCPVTVQIYLEFKDIVKS